MKLTSPLPDSLRHFFEEHKKIALAFSGGTDSAYLLWAGKEAGCDIKPFFIKSAFQPEFELMDAAKLSEESELNLTILELDVLADETIRKNPSNRCYYCKTRLFTTLKERAAIAGYDTVIDGTNASDDVDDRPGMKALAELGILSPLRLCGITKEQVRTFSEQVGLFTAKKPSYACLATRIPAGTEISASDLQKIERSEASLREMGYENFRIRLFHGCARIQLPESLFDKAVKEHGRITEQLCHDFDGIFLDLIPRVPE